MSPVNDADFRQSEKDWHALVDKVTERLIEIDDTVPELPVKDVVSRPDLDDLVDERLGSPMD